MRRPETDVSFRSSIICVSRCTRYRMEYLKDRQSHSLLVKEHEEIVQGLTERDADRALRVTNSHIERQRDYIIQQLQHK